MFTKKKPTKNAKATKPKMIAKRMLAARLSESIPRLCISAALI